MSDGRDFKKEYEIIYCVLCHKFSHVYCACQNSNNKNKYFSIFLNWNYSVINFFYVTNVIGKFFTNTCLKSDQRAEEITKITLKGFHDIYSKQNLISKYIYLCFNDRARRNINYISSSVYFLVMATNLENEATIKQLVMEKIPVNKSLDSASPSSSSISSKKSAASSVLTKISNSLKWRKKPDHESLSPMGSSMVSILNYEGDQNMPVIIERPQQPKSKIPIPILRKQQNQNEGFKNERGKSRFFFKKIVYTHHVEDESHQLEEESHNIKQTRSEPKLSHFCETNELPPSFSCTPTNFHATLDFQNDFDETTNLSELLRLSQQVQESEMYLAHIISLYIQDPKFEKELLGVVGNHAKLQNDAERRAQSLVHETWLQQSENMNAQELELQESLRAVIKKNKRLQEELDNLIAANEKLVIDGGRQYPSNQIIDDLTKNNDDLRFKISMLSNEAKEREKEEKFVRNRNQHLEEQARRCHFKLNSYKVTLQRIQMENELEQANLIHQLQVSQMTIKETAEAGDVLLEDVDSLKRQFKSMPCTINWSKFKSRGSSLPDLIYMCRSCINEVAKELIASQTEIALKEKDCMGLKAEIERKQDNIQTCKCEEERLRNQLKMYDNQDSDLKKCLGECRKLERELGESKEKNGKFLRELEREQINAGCLHGDLEKLKEEAIEKEEELILHKEKMCEYKSENETLRMQIHGLKQVLNASGSGDVARELADVQEKMSFFQSQYYQLLSEKNYLIEELQSANVERGALNQFQTNYYQFIQVQQHDLEVLNRDNLELKQKLQVERGRVTLLENEKIKLKEEKNIMREIYRQLKSEINKTQLLQGEVTGMNVEASRLAIIAEYNKQLGEKLQSEVTEREVTIVQLQSSVDKLSTAQIENTKDKVALCVELTEVCTINNQLSNSLVAEHQKSSFLDESKKILENKASNQLRAMEEMQMSERAALKELLKDFKCVVAQRDNLMALENEYVQQVTELQNNTVIQARHFEELNHKYLECSDRSETLQNKLSDTEKDLDKCYCVVMEKDTLLIGNEEELKEIKSKIDALEGSKTYLQNTIQKLHSDLNEARENELETKQLLKQERKKNQVLQFGLDHNKKSTEVNWQRNEELAQENLNLRQLLAEYEERVEKCCATEENMRNHEQESRMLAEKREQEIETLKEIINEKDLEGIEMQECSKTLLEHLNQMETFIEDVDVQSKILSENNSALVQLQAEHKNCISTIASLNAEKEKLQDELNDQLEEHDKKRQEMEEHLHILSSRLDEARINWEGEKMARAKLTNAHKELAKKLLKAVRMLIDEKILSQNAQKHMGVLSQEIKQIRLEKILIENQANATFDRLQELEMHVSDLTEEKRNLQHVISDLHAIYKTSEAKFLETAQELNKIKSQRATPTCSKTCILLETKSQLHIIEERVRMLKGDLEISHNTIIDLKTDISSLKQQLTAMEFQKCETALRLHETETKLTTVENINGDLAGANQTLVSEVLRLTFDGKISSEVSETLLKFAQGQRNNNQ